jgi:hypothetical protein
MIAAILILWFLAWDHQHNSMTARRAQHAIEYDEDQQPGLAVWQWVLLVIVAFLSLRTCM